MTVVARVEQAIGTRKCRWCEKKISKGIFHLHIGFTAWKQSGAGNICNDCIKVIADEIRIKNGDKQVSHE